MQSISILRRYMKAGLEAGSGDYEVGVDSCGSEVEGMPGETKLSQAVRDVGLVVAEGDVAKPVIEQMVHPDPDWKSQYEESVRDISVHGRMSFVGYYRDHKGMPMSKAGGGIESKHSTVVESVNRANELLLPLHPPPPPPPPLPAPSSSSLLLLLLPPPPPSSSFLLLPTPPLRPFACAFNLKVNHAPISVECLLSMTLVRGEDIFIERGEPRRVAVHRRPRRRSRVRRHAGDQDCHGRETKP